MQFDAENVSMPRNKI